MKIKFKAWDNIAKEYIYPERIDFGIKAAIQINPPKQVLFFSKKTGTLFIQINDGEYTEINEQGNS